MLAIPQRSEEEVRANAAFDALLWALSRPGQVRQLPEPGEASIIAALVDRECRVHAADPLLIPQISATGALLSEIGAADHVFLGRLSASAILSAVQRGSDLYPDDGATVILRATLGEGAALRLTGPGVDGACELRVAGLPEGFWQARADLIRYPTGFDLFLVDGTRVVGVPRSTLVEDL